MVLKYLGTAAAEGFPALFCKCEYCMKAKELGGKNIRTRSQAIIDNKLLIDLPADTYMHYLTHNIDLPGVDNLVITHSHNDHFYPMELEMRCPPYFMADTHVLNVYGNGHVGKKYSDVEELEPGIKAHNNFNLMEPFKAYDIGKYEVTAILANHDKTEDCFNYIIKDKKEGELMLYAHDTGFYKEETWDFIKNYRFDLISMDCTTGYEDDGDNHMGFNDTIKFREMCLADGIGDEKTKFVISHFSHGGRFLYEEFVKKANEYEIIVAYDGLEISI